MRKYETTLTRRSIFRASTLLGIGLLAACAPAAPAPPPTTKPATSPSPPPAPTTAAKPTAAAATKPTTPMAAPTSASRSFTPVSVTILNTAANNVRALQGVVTKQFFKPFEIDAKVEFISDNTRIISSLVSGSGDICAGAGLASVFPAIEQGASLKVLGGTIIPAAFILFTNDPQINSLADLDGRTVGIGSIGALLHQIMVALFRKNGLDESKVTFVNIGTSTEVFRAIAAGKVDAGLSTVDFVPTVSQYPGVRPVLEAWKDLPDFVQTGLFATDQTISQKRDALVRVLAAYGQAYRYLKTPESETAYVAEYKEVGGDEAGGRAQWQWWRHNNGLAYDLALSERQISYVQDLNLLVGTQKTVLPFDQVADMSLARDALKLMQ